MFEQTKFCLINRIKERHLEYVCVPDSGRLADSAVEMHPSASDRNAPFPSSGSSATADDGQD